MRPTSLLVFLICFASLNAAGQFQKGTKMLGATIGSGLFTSGKTDFTYPTSQGYAADNINFNISIQPSLGYFLNNRTVAGFSLLVNSIYQKVNNKTLRDTIFQNATSSNTDFGAGGFIRYYLNTSKDLAPFLHLYMNAGSGTGKTSGFSFGTDATGAYKDSYTGKATGRFFYNAGLEAGITKMIRSNVGIDAFVGYTFSYSKISTETVSLRDYTTAADITQKFQPTQKYTGNGVNVGIGVQVFLPKK